MLAIDFNIDYEISWAVDRHLATIAAITVVSGDARNVRSINSLPLVKIRDPDRTKSVIVILVERQNLNFTHTIAADEQITVDVYKLKLEQVSVPGFQ